MSLGLVITTFRREQYVKHNLILLEKYLFSVLSSQQFHVYVVDNGQTLDLPDGERLTIIPSANYGGSGGFARGMLEIEENRKHSHIVFCDDDAVYEPESFVRLLAFLSMAQDADLCVGGTMFRLDQPNIIHESGASYYDGTLISNKHQLDMSRKEAVVTFNVEEYSFSHAWWFFAFPASFARTIGYPMPFFFRGDDMEFSWRLRKQGVVTTDLNGICVWHEAFEKKSAIMTEYYIARNEAIMRLIHEEGFTAGKLVKKIARSVLGALLTYRYGRAEMVIRGYSDLLKGPVFLKSANPPQLHTDLLTTQKEKMMPISKEMIVQKKYHRPIYNHPIKSLAVILTLNGMLFPSFLVERNRGIMSAGYAIEPLHSKRLAAIYRKETVLYIDIDSKQGYLTGRSVGEFWKGTIKMIFLIFKVMYKFSTIRNLYREEFSSMVSRAFWKKFLDTDTLT